MAAPNRTIYTQSEVRITTGNFGVAQTAFAVVSGVQNASVSLNSPRQDVNALGRRGIIDKVQVEAESSTATFSFILPDSTGNGNHLSPAKLNEMMQNSLLDSPTGFNVSVAGIGCVYSGLLSSFTINAAVGDLPTCEMTIEGIPSGGTPSQDLDAELPDKISPDVAAITYPVLTSARVSGLLAGVGDEAAGGNPDGNSIGNFGAAVQSASFSWEVPVERILSLGDLVTSPAVFTNPPGTASITAEGMDMPSGITGIVVGGYTFAMGTNSRIVSRDHNIAVGDISATYNMTIESTADSCVVSATA
jgi:hypothetical protein